MLRNFCTDPYLFLAIKEIDQPSLNLSWSVTYIWPEHPQPPPTHPPHRIIQLKFQNVYFSDFPILLMRNGGSQQQQSVRGRPGQPGILKTKVSPVQLLGYYTEPLQGACRVSLQQSALSRSSHGKPCRRTEYTLLSACLQKQDCCLAEKYRLKTHDEGSPFYNLGTKYSCPYMY